MHRLSRLLGVGIRLPKRPRADLRSLLRQGMNDKFFVNEDILVPLKKKFQNKRNSKASMNNVEVDTSIEHHVGGDPTDNQNTRQDSHIISLLVEHLLKMETSLQTIEGHLLEVMTSIKLRDITTEMKDIKLEWQMIASTLDRMFFIVFVISIAISLVLLFPRPYNLTWEGAFGENNSTT